MENEQAKPDTIEKDYAGNPALDFAWLRRKGIELVQQFSGKVWTDFNLHDPGVTILEQVCFALTDLAYRTNAPIADLLAAESGRINHATNSFFSREQILSTGPVFVTDYRKLVVDSISEVNNIWLEPVTSPYTKTYARGRYKVIIQLDDRWQQQLKAGSEGFAKTEELIEQVRMVLSEARNVGEDFEEFIVMQPQRIIIDGEILLYKKAVSEEVLAHIYHRLEKSLNPPVVFYTEKELLAKGYAYEDIYSGPLLKQGIVLDEELRKIKTVVDPAELIKAISGIDDVLHIRKLEIGTEAAGYSIKPLVLQKYHYPLLVFDLDNAGIRLYYDKQPLPVNGPVFGSLLQRLRESMKREFVAQMHDETTDAFTKGVYRNIEAYTSLQHFFPAIYRIGNDGIEFHDSPERKAHTRQLKAYLMLYEQVIAGYLSQLAHINELFSYEVSESQAQTYFYQPLYNVPGAKDIIKAFTDSNTLSWEAFTGNAGNAYIAALKRATETDVIFRRRKKRILEHLLSRFNILPDKYPVMLFELYYGDHSRKERVDEELQWKSVLLQNALLINNYRVRAVDYKQYGSDMPAPGFAYNMKLLLHIKQRGSYSATKALSAYTGEAGKKHNPQLAYYKTTVDGEIIEIWIDENLPVNAGFVVRQIPLSFFHWGADPGSYKILVHPVYAGEYLAAIKKTGTTEWMTVGRYSSRMEAVQAQRLFIEKLQELSIASEGFSIVEHLLLAPAHDNEVFSFRFYDEAGGLLLQQLRWTTWEQREETVKKLLEEEAGGLPPADWLQRVQSFCKMYMPLVIGDKPEEVQHLQQLTPGQQVFMAGKTKQALLLYRQRKANFYPRFLYQVERSDKSVVSEDFYNARITVVFPSWPRRFQDKGFREFAETLFRNHLPAHIQPAFLWLDISQMKRYEVLHHQWCTALKRQKDHVAHAFGEALLSFLLEQHQYQLL